MNLRESYQRLFKSRPSSNDASLLKSSRKPLTENTKMKKFFTDLLTTAQAQGKFEDVVKFLDDEYGVWFTDDAKITPQALQSKINRSDFSAMSSSDIKDIEKEVKNILMESSRKPLTEVQALKGKVGEYEFINWVNMHDTKAADEIQEIDTTMMDSDAVANDYFDILQKYKIPGTITDVKLDRDGYISWIKIK